MCTPLEAMFFVTWQNLDTAATKTSNVCCYNSLRFSETFSNTTKKEKKKPCKSQTRHTNAHTHMKSIFESKSFFFYFTQA